MLLYPKYVLDTLEKEGFYKVDNKMFHSYYNAKYNVEIVLGTEQYFMFFDWKMKDESESVSGIYYTFDYLNSIIRKCKIDYYGNDID